MTVDPFEPPTADSSPADPLPAPADIARGERARASLRGLAVGDALGSQFFVPAHHAALRHRELPRSPWRWTDDTEMACSVVAVLTVHGTVDQDALAASFAQHYDVDRGYGPAVSRMLRQMREETAGWRDLAASLFEGRGSWGNGAAMRIAPLGAWFADDVSRAVTQAELATLVTHRHPEAVAGAVAVAVAAALVARVDAVALSAESLLDGVLARVPRSAVWVGLYRARDMLDYADIGTVTAVLGCGRRTSAQDTVPFALWAAARHLDDFSEAMWTTIQAGGDADTTSAIVGGILASASDGAPPADWTAHAEALPRWVPGV